MKESRRVQRMKRHHKRHKGAGAINLVSMMDIFTILVFFLLFNSSEVEVLPSAKSISLPESVAEEQPREAVVVMVTASEILVQGQRVAAIGDVLASDLAGIPALSNALEELAGRRVRTSADVSGGGPEVTIMGEKGLPFRLLKKVMLACSDARYGQVSFAVLQKAESGV